MMRKKLSLSIVMFLLATIFLVGCGSNNSSENKGTPAAEEDTFKVGLEAGYAPFNWTQIR